MHTGQSASEILLIDILPTWEYAAGVREGWIKEVTLDEFFKMITALIEFLQSGEEVELADIQEFGEDQFDSALSGTASSK